MLKKSRFVFWAVSVAAAVLCGAISFLLNIKICIIFFVLYLVFIIWWSLFYNKLEYRADDKTLCIKSGVILKRAKLIRRDRILWESRITVPFCKCAVITRLHTACGTVTLLCDFQPSVENFR